MESQCFKQACSCYVNGICGYDQKPVEDTCRHPLLSKDDFGKKY